MPVQSGSDRVLKRMIRRYTRAEYVARVRALCQARPGLTLSPTSSSAFRARPSEDFEPRSHWCARWAFSGLFGFKYSRRPHTPAERLADDVPESVKSARLAALFAVSEELLQGHLTSLVGSSQEVLVEGASKSGGERVTGRTEHNAIVHIADPRGRELIGQIVQTRIVRSFKHSLEGEVLAVRPGRPPSPALPAFARAREGIEVGAPVHGALRRALPVLAEGR